MLDLDLDREGVPPRDAATLVLVRDGAAGLEVFCVERHKASRFLGGAIVFPGGKVDDADRDPSWRALVTPPRPGFGDDEDAARAFAVAACRESLEEAAILPVAGRGASHEELLALRSAEGVAFREAVAARGFTLDLAALKPFARWVTPTAEARRFDARFFLAVAPASQPGAHDERETMASFWAQPDALLARFLRGEIMLAPPTHRTIEILAAQGTAATALAAAEHAVLEPICPRLVRHVDAQGETTALTLPGDPEHDVPEPRVPGKSRYVLRGDRFLPEDPPPGRGPQK